MTKSLIADRSQISGASQGEETGYESG